MNEYSGINFFMKKIYEFFYGDMEIIQIFIAT